MHRTLKAFQTTNFYLILTFLNKKGNSYLKKNIYYKVKIESPNRKPFFPESALVDFVLKVLHLYIYI